MDYFSNLPWPSLAYLILLVLLLIVFQLTSTISSTKLPPGPPTLPLIGSLHYVTGLPHHSLHQLSKKFGDLVYLQLGRVPTIVVSSADLVEKVLKTHDQDFCSRPQRMVLKTLTYNYHDVAFSPYGDNWKLMRKIMTMELLSNKRVQSTRSIREEEVAKLVKEIAEASSANHMATVDLSGIAVGLSQNIICRIVLGQSWSSCEGGARNKLVGLLEEAQAMMGSTFMADYLPWASWVDVIRRWNKRLKKCFQGLDEYFVEVIDEHLHPQTTKVQERQEDFVDVLLKLEKDFDVTRDQIKAVMQNIFMAGIVSNSGTIVWAMSELLRNRRVMTKAQEEVRQIVGSTGKVDEDDIKELPYLSAIVKETLRLHPPGPLLIPRQTIRKCTINGYEIPPNTQVLVNVFSVARDPRFWKDPLEFLPERFLDGSIDFKGNFFEFVPFGAGRRICPGMQLGAAIVELALANLLYSFDWDLPWGIKREDIDMTEGDGMTVCKKTPLIVVPNPVYN